MYEPQPSPMERARQSFVKIIRHKQDMEDGAMKLLKHPDATEEQIMKAREMLIAIEEPLGNAVRKLRAKYLYVPISPNIRPWYKPEFDKYMEVRDGV